MNHPTTANPGIVTEQAKLGIWCPAHARVEAQPPTYLALVPNRIDPVRGIWTLDALISVDVKYPLPSSPADRVVARSGKVVAPFESMKLDWELEGLCDCIVDGAGIYHNDFIHNANE